MLISDNPSNKAVLLGALVSGIHFRVPTMPEEEGEVPQYPSQLKCCESVPSDFVFVINQ